MKSHLEPDYMRRVDRG